MKKRIPIFKFHVSKKELTQYFNPVCSVCKRSQDETNKHTDLNGIKVLAGMGVFVIDGKAKRGERCNYARNNHGDNNCWTCVAYGNA